MSGRDNSIRRNRGNGYINKDGMICMVRCFECGNENYSPAVSSGSCYKCGYTPGKYEPQHEMHIVISNQKRPCRYCAGFGVFNDNKSAVVKCSSCKSVHPNAIGLAYIKVRDDMFIYLDKERVK